MIEKLKELSPVAVYLMREGPFGENTVLVVLEKEDPERFERIVSEIEEDYDFAMVSVEEFEKIKDVVEKSGERLW